MQLILQATPGDSRPPGPARLLPETRAAAAPDEGGALGKRNPWVPRGQNSEVCLDLLPNADPILINPCLLIERCSPPSKGLIHFGVNSSPEVVAMRRPHQVGCAGTEQVWAAASRLNFWLDACSVLCDSLRFVWATALSTHPAGNAKASQEGPGGSPSERQRMTPLLLMGKRIRRTCVT